MSLLRFSVTCLFCIGFSSPAPAEVENTIPLGIEALATYRSHYIYRGVELSDQSLDFQLQSEIALNRDTFLNVGIWHVEEISGGFSETSGLLSVIYQKRQLRSELGLTQRQLTNSFIKSGGETFLKFTWDFTPDFNLSFSPSYDFASQSFLADFDANYSQKIGDSSYWSTQWGIGGAEDFYGASGVTDFHARFSLTYHLNSQFSVSPFIGYTKQLSRTGTQEESTVYTGLWLAFFF